MGRAGWGGWISPIPGGSSTLMRRRSSIRGAAGWEQAAFVWGVLHGRRQTVPRAELTAVVAANGRAQALADAERAAAAEQGREQRRRFLEPGSGYQPGNAQMFNDGN